MENDRLKNMKEFWETMAENYMDYEIPTPENNKYMEFLKENHMLEGGGAALDIGCGGGKYSFATAPYFDSVTGIDISENMIGIAEKRREKDGIKNVEFKRLPWQELDVEALGWKKKYDFVFAHMTPAISGEETIKKLRYVAKDRCAVTRFVCRKNPLAEEINRICGDNKVSYGENELCMLLKMLWDDGIKPQLFYESDVWDNEKPMEKAFESYFKRMSIHKDLSDEEVANLRKFIEDNSTDGIFREVSNVNICTIYWREK